MKAYFDSSALAKRYVLEPGSDRVEEVLSSAESLGISVLCVPEVVSALCRLVREKKLSKGQYATARKVLFEDVADCSIVHVTDSVVARSVAILERWPLRSADALHVASAAEWSADLFVSADDRQCRAAREYGLAVEELRNEA